MDDDLTAKITKVRFDNRGKLILKVKVFDKTDNPIFYAVQSVKDTFGGFVEPESKVIYEM